MEVGATTDFRASLRFDEAIFNTIRDPKPDETSRFLNIIDSPTNSEDESRTKPKDFVNPFFNTANAKPKEPEEVKNGSYFPTKVVLAKNLPPNTTELDLHSVWESFGLVKKVFILIQINNAFVEFETKEGAQKWVNSNIKPDGPSIKGVRIKFCFTGREEIVLEGSDSDYKNNILLVSITNIWVPIDIHTLAAVFNNYGNVLKIVTFHRIHGLQALIEMSNIPEAEQCLSHLNNKDLYPNWNTLKIQYSSQSKLEITKECKNSIDFTKHSSEQTSYAVPHQGKHKCKLRHSNLFALI